MKVLVVHNRYRSATPSGENTVVDSEIAALRGAGVEVVPYLRSSDELSDLSPLRKATVPVMPVVSPAAQQQVRTLLRAERPDVMHLHNAYPLLSPMVVRAARAEGVPVVHTVHNHRHVCMKGTYFRDGRVCTDCVGHAVPWPGIAHGCYQGSRLRSLPMAVSLPVHRRTWALVDRFLALTPQLADHLVDEAGVDRAKITVRPNTVPDPGWPDRDCERDGILFVGRLSEEKGIDLLVRAWDAVPPHSLGPLVIVGDGPLRSDVDALAAHRGDVRVLGAQSPLRVRAAMRAAKALVIPSTCPEAFPRVAVEALSNGLPLVATALGGLPGIVTPATGELVQPVPRSLADGLVRLVPRAGPAGEAARQLYLADYHPAVVMRQLLDIYGELSGASR